MDEGDIPYEEEAASFVISKKAYASAKFPKMRDLQYSKLKEACTELLDAANDSGESGYRNALVVIMKETQLLNRAESIAAGASSTSAIAIKPPLT